MFNVVIVDDEHLVLNLMNMIVGRNAGFSIVGSFTDPHEALKRIPELRPDILFLDIEMPLMNGMELARLVRERFDRGMIVFTTAHMQYALEAFDVEAIDYVLKPVSDEVLERIRKRLLKRIAAQEAAPDRGESTIRCFGGFEVRGEDGKLVRFPTRKTEELLAYLLCHPDQNNGKWRLAELLWPEMDGERAIHNLHSTMHRLKKTLKNSGIKLEINKSTEGYVLETGQISYDLLAFEQAKSNIVEASIDWERGDWLFTQYRGPLYDEKPYLWKLPPEEKFRRMFERIAAELVRRDLLNEEPDRAERRLQECRSVEPLHIELHERLADLIAEFGYKRS
ncbi:response regulator [Paenibacillus sp. HB172176]|uniref:response regulator n=1 Tax=Paenibacillus sp. HB172176 TaxID=2493690 RepID=UPI00143BC301|nr:response regulator [Paenibacillus sp. HB172176]